MTVILQALLVQSRDSYYEISKALGNTILVLFLGIIVLLGILLIRVRKKSKKETWEREIQKELQESNKKLESAYKEVTDSRKELSTKYEELGRNEEKNRKLAYTDYLTELPNRIAFADKLEHTLGTMEPSDLIAIMYIDLDNFKNINDSLGHSYGDELIIDVSHRMKEAIDEKDFLSRFGGDEFIILTKDLEADGAEYENKIKKIQKVFSYPFVLATKEFFITISIGITLAPKDGNTTQTLIKNVDAAMYVAKGLGKNTYCYYDESINRKLLDKIELQSEIRKSSENHEFEVYYQAQIDLNSDKIVGFEALVRWNHPERGLITPMDFVPLAEETGLIVPIGGWVLKQACKQLKAWEDKGFCDINVAVNLSARQFKDENLVQLVYDVINDTGVNPRMLELEITESIALVDIEYSISTIKKLKEIGVQFSLDDFGTGYSSMSYLKKLPVKNLKIDKSFLDTIMKDTNDQKIVSTIVNLAQILDIEVIAEGVEYKDQALFLKGINCDRAQGYLYSRPVPSNEAEDFLLKYNKL